MLKQRHMRQKHGVCHSPCTCTYRVCSNKGDKVVLGECLSVLLKMNAVQFTLDVLEFMFFFNNISNLLYIMKALFNGKLKLVDMVALLLW